MRKSLLAAAGLLAAAAVVRFAVAPRVLERLQPGDEWHAEFIGVMAVPDEKTATFPPATSARYSRRFMAEAEPRPGTIAISDSYTITDAETGKITYQFVHRDTVDRRTGRHMDEGHAGDVYLLPRFAAKTEYRLRASYLEGVPLRFEDEETIAGLDTYIFSYRGFVEYTEAYVGTPDYPGLRLPPDHEIRCADDQFVYRVWVEPVTGDVVKLQENCLSGDYVFDRASGRRLTPVLIWGGETAGDDVVRRAESIRAERTRILLATRYVPGGLLIAALVVLGAAWTAGRRAAS